MSVFREMAKIYKIKMNMNVLPLKGKRPMIVWDRWQTDIQSEDDIEKMVWKHSTGLGGIQGINDYRCLDLDGVEDFKIIELILKDLELPDKYRWVVQSGSGKGFHIYIRSTHTENERVFERIGGEKAVYKFKMKSVSHSESRDKPVSPSENQSKPVSDSESQGKKADYCKHIELRWMNCQTTLPPSRHESGGIYNFFYYDPIEQPAYVELEKVIDCLEKYCVMEGQRSKVKNIKEQVQVHEQVKVKIFYDKGRLESALEFLSKNLPNGSYEEWYKIGFALAPLGKAGEKYFVDFSLKNPNYNDSEFELRKKFESFIKDYDGRVTIGSIYHIAEIYGWKKPLVRFWFRDSRKIKISRIRFKKFLESEGFCRYKMDPVSGGGANHLFVRIENNIVEEIDSTDVKEFVMNYLERMPIEELEGTNRNEIIDAFIKSAGQLFTQQFLEFLITRRIEFNKDTQDKAYFYFKNGFVEVGPLPCPTPNHQVGQTENGAGSTNKKFYDYSKLNKHIWRKQIIGRNFVFKGEDKGVGGGRSVFEDFLFNVCRNEVKRYEALKNGIGYLLHNYKDPSIAKAVVFIDEKLSDGAFGRSGKGLVIKSIGQIRNVVVEDGRNFNPSKNFAFQRVKADTNIIGFEDIRAKFPFERLFSLITDGCVVERKNKDEIFIPFSESPKIVLSTNFSISGVDDSTLDRQFIIEFSDYYNKSHRPVDDFGKPFFSSWNESEWSDFDNFMIGCLQMYLTNGLVAYEYINLEMKRLIDETCSEFVEFAEVIELGKEYEKKELFENFKKEYEEFDPANGTSKLDAE